jgi:hypothetical protein
VPALPDRGAEIFARYLTRATEAGRTAGDDLAE